MESGAYDEARAILQESVQAKPDQAEAWELTIELLSLSNKQTALSECAAQLGSMGSSKESLQATALGHLAMIQGNYDAARKHFQQAHAQDRECAFVLESLTKVDVQQDRIRDAREHSRLLLKLDPENPFGHYVTAFLHIIDGNSDAAEVSLRKSIGLKKSAEALHDLAWILNSRAAYEEAEIHAQAAVEITEFNPTMWDTLGQILMNRERLTEAEGAFNHSLSLKSDNVDTLLNLTEIHARLGNRPRALELDAVLSDMQNELSPAARDRLGHIRDLVAQG
jgi:tetratricopeptide (TPR) repeat protein